jgi:DNA-3-methyladenine glycosylase II
VNDAHAFLREDPDIGPLVNQYGKLTLTHEYEPFERLVVSIINQQLSVASAEAIRKRLFDQYAVTPEAMLVAEEEPLRDLGLSGQKIEYLRNVAREFEDGVIVDEFAEMTDEEVLDYMTGIHGIGDWTAKMFAMFVLGREDVFPVEDLGIRRGIELLYGDLTQAEMRAQAENWRPYRSVASLYLWHEYEGGDATVGTN